MRAGVAMKHQLPARKFVGARVGVDYWSDVLVPDLRCEILCKYLDAPSAALLAMTSKANWAQYCRMRKARLIKPYFTTCLRLRECNAEQEFQDYREIEKYSNRYRVLHWMTLTAHGYHRLAPLSTARACTLRDTLFLCSLKHAETIVQERRHARALTSIAQTKLEGIYYMMMTWSTVAFAAAFQSLMSEQGISLVTRSDSRAIADDFVIWGDNWPLLESRFHLKHEQYELLNLKTVAARYGALQCLAGLHALKRQWDTGGIIASFVAPHVVTPDVYDFLVNNGMHLYRPLLLNALFLPFATTQRRGEKYALVAHIVKTTAHIAILWNETWLDFIRADVASTGFSGFNGLPAQMEPTIMTLIDTMLLLSA